MSHVVNIKMLTVAALLACAAAFHAAPEAIADCGDSSQIVRSFIDNRFRPSAEIDLTKDYWQAHRESPYNNNAVVMTVCDPVAVAGSTLNHDTKDDPVELGEAGWLNTVDSKNVIDDGQMYAWISDFGAEDWRRIEVLDSGNAAKWEAFTNPDSDTNVYTCDEYFANLNGENDGPPETREQSENCWAKSYGVDLSVLPVGHYQLKILYYSAPGNGPADIAGYAEQVIKEITVNP